MKTLIVEDDFTAAFAPEILNVYGPVHIAVNRGGYRGDKCRRRGGEPYDLICLDI